MGILILPFLRLAAWFYALLPRPLQIMSGRLLGAVFKIFRPRKKIVEENLQRAFPGNDPSATQLRRQLSQKAYDHLGHLTCELMMVLGKRNPMSYWTQRFAQIEGVERILQACHQGRGAIVLASHVGNWEILSAMGARSGLDLMIVTKQLQPSWFHSAAEIGRASYGVDAAYEPKTLRKVLAHLQRSGAVGFILDQYAGPPIGVRVPFFGIPVGTPNIIATLVKRTGAAVIPALSFRDRDGVFRCEVGQELDWITDADSKRELALNTANYARVIEDQIRSHPDQWLWIHRRFKGDLSPLRNDEWLEGRSR